MLSEGLAQGPYTPTASGEAQTCTLGFTGCTL